MKKIITLILLASVAFSAISASKKDKIIDPANLYPQVKMETSMGTIVVELDRIKAPIAVNNFLYYVITNEYNNTIFHRVIEEFVVQGGGYDVDFIPRKEHGTIFNESGNGLKNTVGTIAMARQRDPHSSARQFYFNMDDNADLDPGRNWGYTVFGSITYGEEIVEAMSKVKTDFHVQQGWEDVPVEPIVLIKATLMPADYFHQDTLTTK